MRPRRTRTITLTRCRTLPTGPAKPLDSMERRDTPATVRRARTTAVKGVVTGVLTVVVWLAVEAGDVVLVRNDPRDVPRIIALSRASYRKMMQKLWWTAGYNIVAIPLAAGVLAAQGILLPPAFAAVLMSASTAIVAINAQLLRGARL
jgi:Cu2+-exporting ATPase